VGTPSVQRAIPVRDLCALRARAPTRRAPGPAAHTSAAHVAAAASRCSQPARRLPAMARPDDGGAAAPDKWRFRDIRWGKVWRRQDHANMLLTACLIVGVGVTTFVLDPRDENYFIYDATISYPAATKHAYAPTVPGWASIVVPLLMMLLTIVVGEFLYSKSDHHSVTDALAVTFFFLADAIGALACTLLVTQVTKLEVGRLRPDFLARCAPVPPAAVSIQYGQDTSALYPCTSADASAIKDGRQSFPSGHTSFSFNLATYSSAYLIWCW
jgi:membrane-associated phospholipid phosphatase